MEHAASGVGASPLPCARVPINHLAGTRAHGSGDAPTLDKKGIASYPFEERSLLSMRRMLKPKEELSS